MEEQNKEQSNTVEVSELEIESRREAAKQRMRLAKHEWKQRGAWIKCSSCEYPHAFRIPMSKLMTGIDENGMPVLVSRVG